MCFTLRAYYLREYDTAHPSFQDIWFFDLQEGGQCYSKETCDNRDMSMKSSNGYQSSIYLGGIFDNEQSKSPFYGANKVYVPYCSSDGWVGDAAASDLTWGYEFRGQRIIRSVLNDLVMTGRITSKSRVMFAGQSAGARGIMNNVDFLQSYLPEGCLVLGAILDSPYYIDVEPYAANFVGFQNQTMEIFNRYNVDAIIPNDCAEAYPKSSGNGWKCLYGQYRIPFLRTRYLLIASQFDSYQLSNNVGEYPVNGIYSTQGANDYAQMFADTTKQLIQALQSQAQNAGHGYFSWACYNHAVSKTSLFYSASCVGSSESAASDLFLQQTLSSTVAPLHFIEDCNNLFCGADCL